MARLEPFLRSEKDKGLSAEQKLAMAYSAWCVGPSFADVDLNVAINLWQAPFLVLEYIRSGDNPLKREDYLGELKALEGVTIERLAELIPLLPYLFESELPAPVSPGRMTSSSPMACRRGTRSRSRPNTTRSTAIRRSSRSGAPG